MRNARKLDFGFFGFKGKGLFWTASVVLALVVAVPAGALRADDSLRKRTPSGSVSTKTERTSFSVPPNDTYYTNQWYLNHATRPHINVEGAWTKGYTGAGVIIGIADDCFETAHPDLDQNNISAAEAANGGGTSYDYNFGYYVNQNQSEFDPNPVYASDRHGISVAGVAAAYGNNSKGVTGVAPRAGLAGLRIDFNYQTNAMFADATTLHSDKIKVKNHSYGIGASYVSNPTIVTANRASAANGCVNVRAAGNDSANANAKSAQADHTAISVAAIGADGQYAYYSNFGANVFVTAPSSDTDGATRIYTTDRMGYAYGYNGIVGDEDYTNDFGGTSSASPTVAGVVALILEAAKTSNNVDLDVRGVKHVLANTSAIVDSGHSGWHQNGAGHWFNPYYGHGLVDATAAVTFAETYAGPAAEVSFGTGQVSVGTALPDDNTVVSRSFTISESYLLESVLIDIDLDATGALGLWWDDYNILLTSPDGTTSKLGYMSAAGAGQGDTDKWQFSSAEFWGEDPNGQWTLSMQDAYGEDYEADWNSFAFTAYGEAPEPATMSLLAIGGLALLRRRRRRAA